MHPIAFSDPSAVGTRAGRMARIDKDDRHAGQLGLVLNKHPQRMERPTVLAPPLRLCNRHPVADPHQFFAGQVAPTPGAVVTNWLAMRCFSCVAKRCSWRRWFLRSPLADGVPVC